MLCDADIPVTWRARPRTFVALMSLYESNHVRFQRLVGDPARLTGVLTSSVAGDCVLQLAVLEHMPYTSTLSLTYLLPAEDHPGRSAALEQSGSPRRSASLERLPDLRLRAYHDARLLEVETPPVLRRRGQHDPRAAERELRQRWARNMMLNKWLEYCAERGHRFMAAALD